MTFTAYNGFVRDLGRGGIQYAAEHSRALGFSAVEFLDFCGTNPPRAKETPAEEVKRILSEQSLSVDCYSVYADILYKDRDFFEAEIRRQIDYAATLGSKNFHHTIIPAYVIKEGMPSFDEVFDEVLARTGKIAEYCAFRGINCLYEPQGGYFNGVEGLSRLLEALAEKNSNVGLCADLGNSVFVDCDPVDIMRALGQYAKQIHIKDYIISDTSLGLKGENRSRDGKYLYDAFPGKGNIDLAECLRILKSQGYDGGISLEYIGEDADIVDSMEYIKTLWNQ